MKRSALDALDALDTLAVDSLIYLTEDPGGRAESGRSKGLDWAENASSAKAAFGIGIARNAPDGTPPAKPGQAPADSLPFDIDAVDSGGGAQRGPALADLLAQATGFVGSRAELATLLDELSAPAPGPQSLESLVLTDYFSGSADGAAGYDIHIKFSGSDWTEELQQAFIQAADYFTTVITGDIGDSRGLIDGFVSRFVDDLRVTAKLGPIDGVGGVLGQAGPMLAWTPEVLTSVGIMQFDTADAMNLLAKGLWDDTVTHEMMHVLGYGTLWEVGRDLVDGLQYVGENALDAYRDFQNDQSLAFIPVEDGGGAGTAGSHWEESVLDNELMTGFIDNDGNPATDGDNFLSEFSVMSLADLGYQIEYQDYPYDDAAIV